MSKGAAGLGIAIIILLLSAGAIIGAVFLPKILGKVPVLGAPQDHWIIIENMEIVEVGKEGERFILEPICVDHGLRDYSKDYPLSAFTKGEQYSQSTWLFQRHGDTEICLTIWGPSDDQGYDLEASRLVGLKLEIWYNHELIRSMPPQTAADLYTCMPGYVWFTLELE